MKLLILTQKVDKNDPVLGFFHRWIVEFAKKYESIIVVCLYKGECDMPANVRVLSLGKENGESRIKYLINFYTYIWNEKENYDNVFVHMNQEYVILGGPVWKYLKKGVFMWRNHHAGSWITDFAAFFCKKIFCTSRFSYTAKYKNKVLMPVGVDTESFTSAESSGVHRISQSVLSIGRISPSKHIDLFVNAIVALSQNDSQIVASVYGDPLPQDTVYYEGLKRTGENYVDFYKGVSNVETVAIYSAHEIFVNLSSSGMYDKTIFEAMLCGCLVLASNENLRGKIPDDFVFSFGNTQELNQKLQKLLSYTPEQKKQATLTLRTFAEQHSLHNLAERIVAEVQ